MVRAIVVSVGLMLLAGCSEVGDARRTLRSVGDQTLRNEALPICRDGFAAGVPQSVSSNQWPPSVRAFRPLSVWAEPDGAYLLLESDADGERGVYLPRILSEKDPLCSPALKHEKLGAGVYWYDRKRM